jgi:hypothetical protein
MTKNGSRSIAGHARGKSFLSVRNNSWNKATSQTQTATGSQEFPQIRLPWKLPNGPVRTFPISCDNNWEGREAAEL